MHESTNIVIRNKRQTFFANVAGQPLSSTAREDVFLLEWAVEDHEHRPKVRLCARVQVEALWAGERIVYSIAKSVEDIFRLSPAHAPRHVASQTDDELLTLAELCLEEASKTSPIAVLQLLEISRWTFASENLYEESNGPKLKEGALEKASGGYESYNRSRARVIAVQFLVVLICVLGFFLTGRQGVWFISGLLTIALLSFAHWSYFRLNAIDATCVLPCLFFPPVGPILIIAWSVVTLFFEKKDRRWFVLRPGHLEMYDSWEGERREPVGVFLLERQTLILRSKFSNSQFSVITPYRRLRLWATSRAEREDWIEHIQRCVYNINVQGERDDLSVTTASSPIRDSAPCDFYVDGREYFAAVLNAIQNAKREVFIAGWMLSPELYLLRDEHLPEGVFVIKSINDDEDSIVFSATKPFAIELDHEYCIETKSSCQLLAYDIVAPPRTTTALPVVQWEIWGYNDDRWKLLDTQLNVDMNEWDAFESVRFDVLEAAGCCVFRVIFQLSMDPDTKVDDDIVWVTPEIMLGAGIRLIALYDSTEAAQLCTQSGETKVQLYSHGTPITRSNGDGNVTVDHVGALGEEHIASPLHGPGSPQSWSAEEAMERGELMASRNAEQGFVEQAFSVLARSKQESRLDRLRNLLLGDRSDARQSNRSQTNDHNPSYIEETGEDSNVPDLPRRRGFERMMSGLVWGKRPSSRRNALVEPDLEAQVQTGDLPRRVPSAKSPRTPTTSATRLQTQSAQSHASQASNSPRVSRSTQSESAVRSWRSRVFHSRLDRLIARKVLEGVKFHVLLYRDVELFLPNASASAKKKLLTRALYNKNLQVMRHAPEGRATGSVQHWLTCSLSRGKTWWSHHDKLVCIDQSVAFLGGLDLAMGRFDDSRHVLFDRTSSLWKGKDLYNPLVRDFTQLDSDAFSDSMDRNCTPRMPWHDVQCCVKGEAAIDLARRFAGRWNAVRRELKGHDERIALLIPRSPLRKTDQTSSYISQFPTRFTAQCQVLCSVSAWSSPGATEKSILEAYISLIANARESVYIEQQFFSSDLAGFPVKNPIASVLAARVAQAILTRERFRCIIILPVVPAFEGDLRTNYSARSVLHWNLLTIRNLYKKIAELAHVAEVPEEYIGVYSLRKVQESFTEQVYVHSKLLIVDDCHALIGSSNLNDRSMLGTRDSEIAVRFYSIDFARSLRLKLFHEHAGMPIEDMFDARFADIAKSNTRIISEVFPAVPSNAHPTFRDLESSPLMELGKLDLLNRLQGNLIEFPRQFLCEERNLLPRVVFLEREGAVPLENFT